MTAELEWRFIYVGNSHDARFDQELDKITMEEMDFGLNEFVWEVLKYSLQVEPPNYKAIPDETDVLDSTIVMVIVYYKKKKFFRCSYLIRQFYQDLEMQEKASTEPIQWDKLYREIKTDKPIITLYDMVWDENSTMNLPSNINKDQFEGVNLFKDTEDEQAQRNEELKQLNAVSTSGKSSVQSKTIGS